MANYTRNEDRGCMQFCPIYTRIVTQPVNGTNSKHVSPQTYSTLWLIELLIRASRLKTQNKPSYEHVYKNCILVLNAILYATWFSKTHLFATDSCSHICRQTNPCDHIFTLHDLHSRCHCLFGGFDQVNTTLGWKNRKLLPAPEIGYKVLLIDIYFYLTPRRL